MAERDSEDASTTIIENVVLILARAVFIVAGVINVTPLAGVLGAPQLESLYGRPVENADTGRQGRE